MELLTKASRSDQISERERRSAETAYRAACESIVLLKNGGALPFKGKTVAAFGAGVAHTVKGGTGSGEVNERRSLTILDGLKERGFEVTTGPWLKDYEAEYAKAWEKFQKKKKKIQLWKPEESVADLFTGFCIPSGRAVKKKDIAESGTENCVYVLSRQAGEGGDRRLEKGDYLLTDTEVKNIRFCAENYENFVLIINSGSAVDLSRLEDARGLNAILFIGQPGCQGGLAVADILSGAATPSGKLADTWARRYGDFPFAMEYGALNGNLENEYYKEDIYVGYRYFDSFGVQPLFPFGFGLSYAKFKLSAPQTQIRGREISVRLSVKNTGRKFSGKETVQVYASAPAGKLDKEYQQLAAFQKTRLLGPGESQELELRFDLRDLASYRFDDASFVLEAGEYILRVGCSSRSTVPAASLRLEKEIIVSRHGHICPVVHPFLGLRAPARAAEALGKKVPVLTVDPACFETVSCAYHTPELCEDPRVRAFVDALSIREMAEIVVGAGMMGAEPRFKLPGAVGNTTSKFWERGLANIALCDGPAGLRVQQRSTVSPEGKIKAVGTADLATEALPDAIKKKLKGDPEKEPVLYQYATAFPVAANLAQTWNTELLYELGGAVFEEMKEFGCTYWLAPAVNIHRNPLCGRNFEYFSEDPFLCGRLAAALVRGVQREEGYYVTVKHFACNNQEDNRNWVSSNVSERALREIYLRAFERTVKEGGAKGIMTSYNRVNGVYAPNSYDLCTKVLRNEWGFDGVVMTDWYSTLPAKKGGALAMAAGNDLIMPGDPLSKPQIVAAVKKGLISVEDLKRCCCNVVRAILNSATQREYIGEA